MLRRVFASYALPFAGLERPIWIVAAATLANRAGTMVVPFLGLYLISSFGASASEAGHVVSLYGIGALLGNVMGGWASDRVHPHAVQAASLLGSGLGLFVLGALPTLSLLGWGALVLAVLTEASRPAAAAALALHCHPADRARAYSLNRLASNLGLSVGPALGGYLCSIDYRYLFLVDGWTSLAGGAVVILGMDWAKARVASDRSQAALGPMPSPLRDLGFMALLPGFFVLGCVFFQIHGLYPVYLSRELNMSELRIGLLFVVNALLIVLFEMRIVALAGRFPALRVVAVGCLLVCAGFGLLPLTASWLGCALLTVLWTLGEILWWPIAEAHVANRAPDEVRGRYMALTGLPFAIAYGVAPAFGTWLYEHQGPTVPWLLCGLAGVVLFTWFFGLHGLERGAGARAGLAEAVERDSFK